MTLVVNPKNKQQEKTIKAIMRSLDISFHTEEEEDIALHDAIKEGRKTELLNEKEKKAFVMKLKKA